MKKKKVIKRKIKWKVLLKIFFLLFGVGLLFFYLMNVRTKHIVISGNSLVSDNEIDLLDNYLDLTNTSTLNMIRNLMCKAVTIVIGYEPFKYTYISDGYLFGKTPELSELKENARNKQ